MYERQLAYQVRDNVVHDWRTPREIAADEGLSLAELTKMCQDNLRDYDLEDVMRAIRRA